MTQDVTQRLFIGNLPWKTDPGRLIGWLRQIGIKGGNVEICLDRNRNDLPLGYGFIDIDGGLDSVKSLRGSAEVKADGNAHKRDYIELEREFMGRRLRFSPADKKPEQTRGPFGGNARTRL